MNYETANSRRNASMAELDGCWSMRRGESEGEGRKYQERRYMLGIVPIRLLFRYEEFCGRFIT